MKRQGRLSEEGAIIEALFKSKKELIDDNIEKRTTKEENYNRYNGNFKARWIYLFSALFRLLVQFHLFTFHP